MNFPAVSGSCLGNPSSGAPLCFFPPSTVSAVRASQGGGGSLCPQKQEPHLWVTVCWPIEPGQAHLPLLPVLTQLRHFVPHRKTGALSDHNTLAFTAFDLNFILTSTPVTPYTFLAAMPTHYPLNPAYLCKACS